MRQGGAVPSESPYYQPCPKIPKQDKQRSFRMSPSERLARYIRRNTSQKNPKTSRSYRSVAPMLIAAVAVLAAVVFSVSVESRRGGWLRTAEPSAPASNPEVAKNSTVPAAVKRVLEPPATVLPFAPTITATKVDSLLVDNDLDNKADPGDTLRYTVVVGATGEDATGVSFSDTVDPNTNFLGGTLAASAVAVNDTFPVTVTGNVKINSANLAAPFSVVSNDYLGTKTVSTITQGQANSTIVSGEITTTSANGGNIVMTVSGPDIGKFIYNPPAGFEGTDTFMYVMSDNANATSAVSNRTATVSITVSGMIWFINNNSAVCTTLAAGCGRLTNPFSSLAAFAALNNGTGNNPAANDNIFVYESGTDYVGPVTLLSGQKFIGQDATASLSSITGITPATGSDPLPTTTPGAPIVNITSGALAITVGQNNTLRGFTGGNSTGDLTGAGFGTLNVSDVTLNGNGRALDLTTGTLNGSFGSISSANSATTGLSLSGVAGSLTTGSTTVTGSTGIGISVGTSTANLNFAGTSVSTTGGTGVNLDNNDGPITFGDLDISPNANQKAFVSINNSNTTTTTSGTLVTSGAAAVDITRPEGGTTGLSMTLTSVSTTGGPNGIIISSTTGFFTVAGNGGVCTEASPATCSGGQIQNINTGADTDPLTTLPPGTGVALRNTGNISLTRIRINNTNNYGISGVNVNTFTLSNSVVQGTNGTNVASPFRDSSIRFDQLTGTNSINNSLITGGFQHNLLIDNQSGTSQITVTANTIKNTNAVTGDDGFQLEAETTAVVNAFITNNSFAAHGGDHFNLSLINNANVDLTFTGNAFAGGHAVGLGQGLFILGANFNGSFNYDISNNGTAAVPLVGNRQGGMINVNKGSGTGTFSGRIQNNFIGNAAVTNSGSLEAFGIIVGTRGAGGSHTTLIDSNTVRQYEDRGIVSEAGEGAAALNATITNNTVSNFADPINSLHGIHSDNGINVDDSNAVCMDIRANSVATAGNEAQGGSDIRLRKGPQPLLTLRIPNLVGTTAANAQAKIQADNPTATSVLVTGANFTGGAACAQPVLPAPPAGPITASATSELTASATSELSSADALQVQSPSAKSQNILWAARGENKDSQNVISLTPSELSAMVQAAISRWAENGMSAKDFAKLQSLSYEIADLPEGQLATLKGNQITLDTTAAGHGWFFDNSPNGDNEFDVPVPNQELQTTEYSAAHGRVDLLTVLMREIGSTLTFSKSQLVGPLNWLMENTLEPGTRRAPAFKLGEVGKLSVPKARDSQRVAAKSSGEQRLNRANAQLVASNKPRNSRNVSRHHANATRSTPMSFVDVLLNIGTLPAGKRFTLKFDVTVDNPYLGATNQVSNQGTVSGANFANKLTDDPDFGGAADPTLTTIDQPDVSAAGSPASVLEDGAGNLVYTFTREGSTAAALTVNFSVGGTATFNTDYTQTGAATFNATPGTVVIPSGSPTATVTLDPTSDLTVEGNETAILTVIAGTSYDIGAPAAATGTITNDDTDVTVAVAPSSVEEDGAPNLVYTFTRNGVTTGPLTVNFSVGGTATYNNDYTQTGAASFTATDGTVTFASGSSTATVTVDPTADTVVEPNETVILTLTTGTGYNVAAPSTATGTITNDDADVSLAVSPSTVLEDGATNLVYTFTRTGDTTGALVVNFTIGGTADPATDYTQTGATSFTAPNGTVTFAAGSSTATVTVDPTADGAAEANETVIF